MIVASVVLNVSAVPICTTFLLAISTDVLVLMSLPSKTQRHQAQDGFAANSCAAVAGELNKDIAKKDNRLDSANQSEQFCCHWHVDIDSCGSKTTLD